MSRITCEEVVLALKKYGVSTTAALLATYMGTDSRSIATALRAARKDGRVTIHYRKPAKGQQSCGFYRFVRLKPKVQS